MSEEMLHTYPRLNIQKIHQEANKFFGQAEKLDHKSPEAIALRRKAMHYLYAQAEDYAIANNLVAERLDELRTAELLFLYSNLRNSKNPEIVKKELPKHLWDECDERLCQAMDKEWNISDDERRTLLKFCALMPKVMDPKKYSQGCYDSLLTVYRDSQKKLQTPPKPETTPVKTEPEAVAQEADNTGKPVINNVVPEVAVPTNQPRNKDYASAFATEFKKKAPAHAIRFKPSYDAQDDFVRYDLYPFKKQADERPSGVLTIHSENEVTLASKEYQHFVATLRSLKATGQDEVVLGQLSNNSDEAKEFAAHMVAAGEVAGISVKQPFKLQELQKYNPFIGNIMKKQAMVTRPKSVQRS